ncbi:MAG: VWA domain-containing protein [Bacteroidetes bacterium]|nr:VWA domain-containing protein [Bacteroidota bacterium]HET6243662.1 VWA domain-containing protein [Bacteroidia bacterium]
MNWANPEFLYLLLVIPIVITWYWFKNTRSTAEIKISGISKLKAIKRDYKVMFRHSLFVLRLAAVILLIIALARPQTRSSWKNATAEGIDIIISLDVSGSMMAEDFKPNRLEAAKKIAVDFISGRKNDRLGLTIFSGESFTQCPLTTDHAVVKNLMMEVQNGMIKDGTAIGMGLASAVNRLKESEATSKVVILLTDGVNNVGAVAPITAGEIAREFGVRVYTVGIGTKGKAPFPVKTPFGIQYQYEETDVDEPTLTKIAAITGGKYYRATDNQSLKEIYREIDLLEKSKIDVVEYRKKTESFFPLVLMAGLLLMFEFLFRNTLFRSIP